MRNQPRQPGGIPAGGQFAPTFRPSAAALGLTDDDFLDLADDEVIQPAGPTGSIELTGPAEPDELTELTGSNGLADGTPALAPVFDKAIEQAIDRARGLVEGAVSTRGLMETWQDWVEAETAVTAAGYMLVAAIDAEVRRRYPDSFQGDVWGDEENAAICAVTLELLGTVRQFGLPAGEQLRTVDSQKPAVAVLNAVSERFPAAWLAASQEKDPPVRARVSPHRAHYAPSRTYWVDEGTQMSEVRHAVFGERDVPPGVDATRDPLGFWSWTTVEPRKVRAQRRSAEIMVPSPNTDPAVSRQAATHELTHRLEHANPQLARLEEAFIERRCTDADGNLTPLVPLRTGRNEWARDGGFVIRYVGKVYPLPGFWEVLSTGTESVYDGAYGGLVGRDGQVSDDDHRAFVLGCLAAA